MPAEFVPKPLPYLERLQKAQRIVRIATHRPDQRLAVRELCEALAEITTALLEREQGTDPKPEGQPRQG
jgi:hypothetical protein